MSLTIPKKLGHIWIGPLSAPYEWLESWKAQHPDWQYTLYDNDFLADYPFKTRELIEFYYSLGFYNGVADLMRYEILYEFGGLLPPSDAWCYHNTEVLFQKPCAYTVYENELIRGELVSPILACEANNKFVGQLIEELLQLSTDDLDAPWKSTGNLFVAKMIKKYNPDITIFPSHYFNPVHYEGLVYEGEDTVYAKQMFGSGRSIYTTDKEQPTGLLKRTIDRYEIHKRRKLFKARIRQKEKDIFDVNFDK